MASKCNQDLRKKYKVKNWAEYDSSLKARGDITIWISEEAIAEWTPPKTGKKGGQTKYSDLAIETATKVRLLFTRRLRQTEGFLESIMRLMELDLPVPDHTTLSRRMKGLKIQDEKTVKEGPLNISIDSSGLKVYGEGEWCEAKHGNKRKSSWRKLHIAINDKGEIVAKKLTRHTVGDSSCIDNLLEQVEEEIDAVFADGGYDGNPTYRKIEDSQPEKTPRIIIPPKKNSKIRKKGNAQRNDHIRFIREHGREVWEIDNNYRHRLLVENSIYRYKTIVGRKLHSRDFENQKSETEIGCSILNKMVQIGMPVSVPA